MAFRRLLSYELKVGITAGVALLCLTVMIFTIKKIHLGEAGYPIYVYFEFVDAIKPQADVVIGGGVKIGKVSDIKVAGDKIRLNVNIDRNVKLPKSAKFQILSKGLMGDKYLNVVAQADTGEYLPPGAQIQGLEPTNIDKAFQRLGQVADSVKIILGDPAFKTSFGNMMKNFGNLSGRLDRLVKSNEPNVTQGVRDLAAAMKNLETFSQGLERITPHLERMVSRENSEHLTQTLKSLESISTRLEGQIAKIEKGEGVLGILVNDHALGEDLKSLISELKKNPWKLLWKK